MVEKILLDFLGEKLDAPVAMEIPAADSERFVIVQKTAGYETNFIQRATVAIYSYAPTLYKAACLNEDVKEAMKSFHELDSISGVHLNTDYNYTDTITKHYRYQATYDIYYF